MDVELSIPIEPQPDDVSCGPTCLHAVLNYYGHKVSLNNVINEIRTLDTGGTLAVFLANAALQRGFKATIYTYNLQVFDPSWFQNADIDITKKLHLQRNVKKSSRLSHATDGYLEFLQLGGKLKFVDLTTRLIRGILRRRLPILTGLSATYLYRDKREFGPNDDSDDIRGLPAGHFVLLTGYHRKGRTVMITDPLHPIQHHMRCETRELWQYLYESVSKSLNRQYPDLVNTLEFIISNGPLARRISRPMTMGVKRGVLHETYRVLSECLETDRLFEGI